MRYQHTYGTVLLIGSLLVLTACERSSQLSSSIASATHAATNIPSSAQLMPTRTVSINETDITGSTFVVYYWPTRLPPGLIVDPALSEIRETGYFLPTTTERGQRIVITAGTSIEQHNVLGPSDVASEAMAVRGQEGRVLSNGNGYSMFWQEAGINYAVVGTGMALHEIGGVAEALEPVSQQEMRQRFQNKDPSGRTEDR